MKHILQFGILLLLLAGCKYAPYVKYKMPYGKDGQPSFSKWNHFMGSMNPLRTCYDITHYDWSLAVDPDKESIKGTMRISMRMTQAGDSLLFDLDRRMKIEHLSSTVSGYHFKRKRDAVFVIYEKDIPTNTDLELIFTYSGKPPNIMGEGPIIWKEDKEGNPWISTQTEGIGAQYIMPCKDLLYDEPDSVRIQIKAPAQLRCLANGRKVSEVVDSGIRTTTFEVLNPINVYNISFNLGVFSELKKPYTDIAGNSHEIGVYPLKYNEARADTFYDQVPLILKYYEENFGIFPFWEDGCNFVESTFAAMEHQSCIAMGSEYRYDFRQSNMTLVHEIAHEWWGNNISGQDYCDIWLHEGFATYTEALFCEWHYGKESYEKRLQYMIDDDMDARPVQKTCGVRYNSWTSSKDQNIYDKGALLLHTLRIQLNNDSLFFQALKDAQVEFNRGHWSSSEFIAWFNKKTKTDFNTIFHAYLYNLETPTLQFFVEKGPEKSKFHYKWKPSTPKNLKMNVTIKVNELDQMIVPSNNWQYLELDKGTKMGMDMLASGFLRFEMLKKAAW